MARKNPASAPEQQEEILSEAVERLTDELRVTRDVLDEVREILSYDQRNPTNGVQHSILKRLPLDPTDDNWGDNLDIVRGESKSQADAAESDLLPQARELIRDLLGTCELNLDELEDNTCDVIDLAETYLRRTAPRDTNAPATTDQSMSDSTSAEATEINQPSASPGPPGSLF